MEKNCVIQIPKAVRDERIGSVFNHLFYVINETENNGYKEIMWDFNSRLFFHPFFLAPLAIYRDRNKNYKNIHIINCDSRLANYFDLIRFNDLMTVGDKDKLECELKPYLNKSYIPLCKFQIGANGNSDAWQTIVQDVIKSQCNFDTKVYTALSFLIGELICNISEHSKSQYGYLYSQYSNKDKCLNLCIADSGITVYGSYVEKEKYLDSIGDNEAKALQFANDGFSTKDTPERGFGIPTSRKILVDGMGGEFFMLSGCAFHRHDSSGDRYVSLPSEIRWDGTIILMRIPVKVDKDFDIYKYM